MSGQINMSDPLRPDIVQRLSIIKYLCGIAVEQSHKPEPLGLTSILTFHDSVELFLQLSTEQLNLQVDKNTPFMKYWDIIDPTLVGLRGTGLSQREAMRRLNDSRVAFKHHGTLPSRLAIDGFRASVTEVFQANTPLVFGAEFASISMLDLITCETTKRFLEDSAKMAQGGDIKEAISKVAISFMALIDDYELRKTRMVGNSPFRFGDKMTFLSGHSMGLKGDLRDLGEFVDKVKESLESLQEGMKILSLDLDYKRYIRFRMLTPMVQKMMGGGVRTYWNPNIEPSIDTYSFCFDFVVDSAIRLQEFDFDVEESRAPWMQDFYRTFD
jgi:hypothetical protein